MTIDYIHEKLRQKKTSCADIVRKSFEIAEKLDPQLGAYISFSKKTAIKQAKSCDQKLEKEGFEKVVQRMPLLGIPVAFKDLFSTKGIETTAGSNILRGYIPPFDATCVRKLIDAGAILIGKLNEDAFGHGGTGQNSDFKITKNPYDKKRVPGGSSSGAGVAVSTESVVFAGGTDTGGSVRNPASFTNTVGLKPTYGLVSRYGIIAMASSLDSIGHITNTVRDSAKVLSITAGFDANDLTSTKRKIPNYTSNIDHGVKGMKIGIPKEFMSGGIDTEIASAVNNAKKIYQKLGAKVTSVSLPHSKSALAVYYVVMPCEVSSNLARYDGIRYGHPRSSFGEEAKRRIMIGTYALSAGFYDEYYLKAQKVRTLIQQDFKKVYKEVDAILAPVTPSLPPKIGEDINDPMQMYLIDVLTASANVAGIPAISVPGGFSKTGLPIGIQLMTDHFEEAKLFQIARAFERETEYYKVKPKL